MQKNNPFANMKILLFFIKNSLITIHKKAMENLTTRDSGRTNSPEVTETLKQWRSKVTEKDTPQM